MNTGQQQTWPSVEHAQRRVVDVGAAMREGTDWLIWQQSRNEALVEKWMRQLGRLP